MLKQFLTLVVLIFVLGICWLKFLDVENIKSELSVNKSQTAFHSNSDVYAQLDVEGTSIHYPVAQHLTEDSYYLTHDVDHNETIYGAVFTEGVNRKDFKDPVTIIYGHSTRDGSMFGTLSNFADTNFFETNRRITIRTQQEVIEYEVFAAYRFTDEHLFETYHLGDLKAVNDYQERIEEYSKQAQGHYRKSVAQAHGKLLILSTCDEKDGERRFVVHARERERNKSEE